MKGLTEKEKFNLIKPLPPGWKKDEKGIPFLNKDTFENIDWNNIEFTSTSNIKSSKNKSAKVVLNFQYDKTILRIYNDIFSYAQKVVPFLAVTTPDFSAYTNMEPCHVEENVRHSLWVGAWLQYLGIKIIPTVTWADNRTYDFCFKYIPKGSVVAISTIGVSQNHDEFLRVFNEMIDRINPPLIIVRGKPINGMEGRFIFVDFDDTFEVHSEYEQLKLFSLEKIEILRKEVE